MKKTSPRAKRSSKQLTAIQTSRHFRVSKHRHTGHVLPRQHTSYPMLAMIVLCVGVLLMSWTHMVNADSFVYPGPKQDTIDVHAQVPGPPPTVAATIDDPADGDVFTDVPITVKGTCPEDTYVSISRNGTFSGVGLCDADGKYSIKTGLFRGVNEIIATVYSKTDQAGPASNHIMVTYDPPMPPTPVPPTDDTDNTPVNTKSGDTSAKKPSGTNKKQSVQSGGGTTQVPVTGFGANAAPLLFKTMFSYQGVYTGEATVWNLSISGGLAPYAINVDWGDNTSTVISRAKAGPFTLQHQYKRAGKYKGSYTAMYVASDALGAKTYMQLVTIVNDPPKQGVVGSTGGDDGPGGMVQRLLETDAVPGTFSSLMKYVWPGYGIVVLMLLSFWLGERRELHYLQAHPVKIRRSRR